MRTTHGGGHLLRMRAGVVVLGAVLALSGCSSKTKASLSSDAKNVGSDVAGAAGSAVNSAAEVLARNVATQQGEQQFKGAGQELSGPLSCAAKVQDGVTKVDITCTGTLPEEPVSM